MKRLYFAALLALIGIALTSPQAHSLVFSSSTDASRFDSAADRIRSFLHIEEPSEPSTEAAKKFAKPVDPLVQWPVPGERITSMFGFRIHPIFHRRIFHEGIDFHAKPKEPIHCVLDGLVCFAGRRGGFGNAVYVYHPNAHQTSMYAHMSQLLVKVGQRVQQGDVVGLAGSTGFSTGVHLHFGVKSADGQWSNPIEFLKSVPALQAIALKSRGSGVYGAYVFARAQAAVSDWQTIAKKKPASSPIPKAVAAAHEVRMKELRQVGAPNLLTAMQADESTHTRAIAMECASRSLSSFFGS